MNWWLTLTVLISVVGPSISVAPPSDWQDKINSFNAFYAANDDGLLVKDGYPSIYLPVIGNGYISHAKGVRSDTMYISGVFNGETTSPSHRARIPAELALSVKDSTTTGVLLDIENGVYHRRGTLAGSPTSWYELRWFAHRNLRSLYVVELDVHSSGNTTVVLENNGGKASEDFEMEAATKVGTDAVSKCGTTRIAETPGGPTHRVCVVSSVVPQTITVQASETPSTRTFISSFRSSLDVADASAIADAAAGDYHSGVKLAVAGQLQQQHRDAWAALWQSGIEVAGRGDVAAAVNASLFSILSSVRDDWEYGLAPGGLTNYYNGHSFWDTETWMYPSLLFLHPTISRSLLQYRFNRLDGARQKAASYDPPFAGTMFPWESAYSGVETCPTFAATGLREDHISGDIALAVWQEWLMRGDKEWLKNVGLPILLGVSEFWVSISTYETGVDGQVTAHINDVIPPDEYVDHVNDSVYTNFVAAESLRFTVQAVGILGVSCEQCAEYSRLAEAIVLPVDTALNIHPEYAGYSGAVVKQADVVLLHYPLGLNMSAEMQKADLEYYSERTDLKGPAMTWGMHSIGYLDLQEYGLAAKYFNQSFQDNINAPLNVWTEVPDGGAVNFITGAGGFLQTLIMGYPGVRQEAGRLTFNPVCPESVTAMRVRGVEYKGLKLDISFTCPLEAAYKGMRYADNVEVVNRNANFSGRAFIRSSAHPVEVEFNGKHIEGASKTNAMPRKFSLRVD